MELWRVACERGDVTFPRDFKGEPGIPPLISAVRIAQERTARAPTQSPPSCPPPLRRKGPVLRYLSRWMSKGTPTCGLVQRELEGPLLAHVSGRGRLKERAQTLPPFALFFHSACRHFSPVVCLYASWALPPHPHVHTFFPFSLLTPFSLP